MASSTVLSLRAGYGKLPVALTTQPSSQSIDQPTKTQHHQTRPKGRGVSLSRNQLTISTLFSRISLPQRAHQKWILPTNKSILQCKFLYTTQQHPDGQFGVGEIGIQPFLGTVGGENHHFSFQRDENYLQCTPPTD